jgi:hypothetical protein
MKIQGDKFIQQSLIRIDKIVFIYLHHTQSNQFFLSA